MSEAELQGLIRAGLRGMEVYHARHAEEENKRFLELAKKYDLMVTGGSDSHGDEDPIGCVRLPYELVERLKEGRRSILFESG
jgi:hypothetical protein